MKKIQVSCRYILDIGIIAIVLSLSSCGMMKESFLSAFKENPVSTDENVSKSNPTQANLSSNTETKGNAYLETEKYAVTASYLNVREKASSKSVKVGGLSKGDQVEVYGFKGNWAEIGFKGGKAFVYKEYVEKIDKGEHLAQNKDSVDGLSRNSSSSYGQIDDAGFHKATPKDSRNELRTEYDGYKWYRFYENGYCGAKNENGDVIISTGRKYDHIQYVPDTVFQGRKSNIVSKQKWFRVYKNKKQGACDFSGREIIAPEKYDKVFYHYNDNKRFGHYYVRLNGKCGICNKQGDEILAPIFEGTLSYFSYSNDIQYYDNNSWVSTGYTFNSRGEIVSSSHSSNNNGDTPMDGDNDAIAELVGNIVVGTLNLINNDIAPYPTNDPQYQRYLNYKNSGLPNASTITFEEFKRADARAAANGYSIDRGGEKDDEPTPPGPKSKDCPHCHHSGKCIPNYFP